MADLSRDVLREQQERLVEALTAASPPPKGFDADRVGLAARTLINKRMRAVKRAWPGLAQSLGAQFEELFIAYARIHGAPADGAAPDAEAFARHLATIGRLGDESFLDLLVRRMGRGFPIRLARLPRSGRRVLAVRLPWWGVRFFPAAIKASAAREDRKSS